MSGVPEGCTSYVAAALVSVALETPPVTEEAWCCFWWEMGCLQIMSNKAADRHRTLVRRSTEDDRGSKGNTHSSKGKRTTQLKQLVEELTSLEAEAAQS